MNPLTLAIDIGGSHLKAAVLTPAGVMASRHVIVPTPRPARPDAVVATLVELVRPLGGFDRVSVGFPGVVRAGHVLTAPNLGTRAWHGFAFTDALVEHFGKPVRLLNDGSVQGLGVISGRGVECVLTLGTGMGFALFEDGRLGPHLELSQHPVKGGKTYDQYIGERELERIGPRHWNRRIRKIIDILAVVVTYDMLYLGGGNSRLIALPLPANVRTVANEAGITGGVRLWDAVMDPMFAARA